MNKQTQHSPLPWGNTDDHAIYSEMAHHGKDLVLIRNNASMAEGEADANAALITHSVNAIGELAEHLGVNTVELAETLQGGGLVTLFDALKDCEENLDVGMCSAKICEKALAPLTALQKKS